MNESELRDGLRQVIATSSPPRPMDTATMLRTARQAYSRRRAVWAGTGAAAGVVVIAVGGTVALSDNWGPGRLVSPAGPSEVSTTTFRPVPGITPPPGAGTGTPWPTGPDGVPQQDRTAHAGPRQDAATRLLDELIAVVPPGYTVPPSQPPQPTAVDTLDPSNDPWRYQQAQFDDRVDGVEVWEYLASVAVSQGDAHGRLFVQVHTPRNNLPTEPCAQAQGLWGIGGECELVDVGGKQVGVVVRPNPGRDDFDQWASYRHADGTVVYVAQSQRYRRGAAAALPQPLFTVQQLAELATAERFHLQ